MAVSLYCPVCHITSKLGTIKCQCGNNLQRNRKYRARFKLPSGKWKSKVVNDLDLARSVEGSYRVDAVHEGVFEVHEAPNIDAVWKKYLKWAKANKRSWRDDETRWKEHIAGHVGSKPMNKITPKDVDAIIASMREKKRKPRYPKKDKDKSQPLKPYSAATIKQVLALIKRVYNWAIKRDLYYGANPANKVEIPKFDNKVTNPLTKSDLAKLLNHLDSWENERAALLIKFALYSGRRRGELLHLTWGDVDLENGLVTFPGAHTKNSLSQTVPLNQNCLLILKRCHELKLTKWVFPSSTGAFFTTFEATWKRLKKRLALPYRFHDLRHTFASYLASSGKVDLLVLKELLGHRELSMTQRYAHLINGALQRGSNVADSCFQITAEDK